MPITASMGGIAPIERINNSSIGSPYYKISFDASQINGYTWDIAQDDDGNNYLLTFTSQIIKLDPTGNIIWQKKFSSGLYQYILYKINKYITIKCLSFQLLMVQPHVSLVIIM